jgi:hypothetical protein
MRKHLLRIFFILLAFDLMRSIGGELPELFRGQPAFRWLTNSSHVLLVVSGFCIFTLYPLSSFVILDKYFRKDKRKSLFYLLLAAFGIITIRYLVQEVFFLHAFGFHNYYANVPLLYFYVDNIYYAVVYSAFGIVYFLVQNEHRRLLENKQLQLENKQTQLSFLQSQVNPHFLFNSLNNIYSLIYQHSPHSLDAVAKLSEILRYMLYNSAEKVSVQKEWSYIQKYIDLQLLRFDHPVNIQQQVKGDLDSVFIPPFLLIPFVENAFKHGDFREENILDIKLDVSGEELWFKISNNKSNGAKDSTGGIGLENIKKRLVLLYPLKHELNVQEVNEIFTINLKLIYE